MFLFSSFEKKFKRLFWNLISIILLAEPKASSGEVRSVLVLRPDRLGDFVLSVPALQTLQNQLGFSGRLMLVAGERNANLARFCFPRSVVWVFKKNIFSQVNLWLRIWFHSFDAVIDFHSYPFSTTTALLTILSGSSVRVGFWAEGDFNEYKDISKRIFKEGLKAPDENFSETQKSFLLVKKIFSRSKLGAAKVDLGSMPHETSKKVKGFYDQIGVDSNDKVLAIHPTLQKRDNRWSQKSYIELIRQLSQIKELKIIVVHGKGEKTELERFQEKAASLPNVFTLPSDDLFFILEAAKRFNGLVCNDSGIMHLCAWVTKIFAIFGPSNAQRWGPRNRPGVKHQIFQSKDGLCDSIKPRQVALALKKELF